MTRQELQALIDRVIGTKGIMRSSAWWVRKLFNKVLEYVESYTNKAVANAKVKSDTEMSDISINPVQNKVIKEYIDKNKVNVDSSMSSSSNNPVQNRVIKAYVDKNKVSIDSSMSSTSTNPVQNKVLKEYVDGIKTVVDADMSATSTNPVQNKVITTQLNKKVDAISGKGLSTNDYTTEEKNKLSEIAPGAEVNVQSDWNATEGDAYIKNKPFILPPRYMTVVALEDNVSVFITTSNEYSSGLICRKIQGSSSGEANSWSHLSSSSVKLSQGDRLQIKSNEYKDRVGGLIVYGGLFRVEGDARSLLYGDDFIDKPVPPYAFERLFSQNKYLVSVDEELLPATELGEHCYNSMFEGCSSLINTPILPCIDVPAYAYNNMFQGCSFVRASEIRANKLGESSCEWMFINCSKLVTAPQLYVTEVSQRSCKSMFEGCTSLISAPFALIAPIAADECYSSMFEDCSSLLSTPIIMATTLGERSCSNMFQNCTSLTTAYDLRSESLSLFCCRYMFSGCSSLVKAPLLPSYTLAEGCYECIFKDCVSLSYIKILAKDGIDSSNLSNWVYNVSATGTFIKTEGTTFPTSAASGIPSGWTVEEVAV